MVTPPRSVSDVRNFLLFWSKVEEPLAGDVPAEVVAHGAACADHLSNWHPHDLELSVAGLLHDVGLLLVPGDELGHPAHGADYARPLFGGRTADLIALHVNAQRYLELTVDGYRVKPPPTAAFAAQPSLMTVEEAAAFQKHPLFRFALELRRADDAASEPEARADAEGIARQVARLTSLVRSLQRQDAAVSKEYT